MQWTHLTDTSPEVAETIAAGSCRLMRLGEDLRVQWVSRPPRPDEPDGPPGELITARYPTEDRQRLETALLQVLGGSTEQTLLVRIHTRAGQERWYRLEIAPIPREGRIVALAVQEHEVPAAERQREQELARLRVIVDTAEDSIFCKGLNRRYTYANPAMERLLGLPAARIVGRTPEEVFGREDASVIEEVDRVAFSGGVADEHRSLTIHGRRRHFHTVQVPFRDARGEVAGICGIVRDVTAQAEAAEALQESERRFRLLSESSPMGAFQTDMEGRVLFTNRRWQEITGLSLEESLGHGWARALHPEDREGLQATWALCVQEGRGYDGEFRFVRPDGEVRWVHTRTSPVRLESGEVVGHVGANEDVTDRKRMEEELLRTQKLDSVAVMAGGIGHDFNNILTTLWCSLSVARSRAGRDAELQHVLKQAELACRRATELTTQLLTFARGGEPVRRPVDLPELVREAVAVALGETTLAAEIELPDDLWRAHADPAQLDRVLQNLLVNARQALPAGGRIRLTARNVVLSEEDSLRRARLAPGRYLQVEVVDDGPGIAPEHRGRIFDPYFTTKEGGSGLGLAVCHSIMRKHRGHIALSPDQGSGAAFTLWLQAAPERARPEGGGKE